MSSLDEPSGEPRPMESDRDQGSFADDADKDELETTGETLTILQRSNTVQVTEIKRLQLELNESRVKHGEEVYWLRLELDSSRREKEAAEDRMAELYHDVQDILEPRTGHGGRGDKEIDANAKTAPADHLCTEPDYVIALQDRLSAYERSVEVLNRQIDMIKTSSEAVVTSMKQEVTDLMEEKSLLEMDLLNQISNLDNAKRNLEVELEARLTCGNEHTPTHTASKTKAATTNMGDGNSSDTSQLQSTTSLVSTSSQTEAKMDEDATHEVDESCLDTTVEPKSTKDVQEGSFRSTAITEESSFMNAVSPHTSSFLTEAEDIQELQRQHSMETQSLREEAAKYQTEAERIGNENGELNEKIEEITKDLMFTRSSANVALALDKIKTDRAETLAQLDRITVLWDRADSTIQILEGLLSEVQSMTIHPEDDILADKEDRERMLSTLETVALVHGQIKMSLMLIELSFRNHLISIQNDSLEDHQQDDTTFSNRLDKVRSETLVTITEAEDKWKLEIERLEKQILANSKSTNLAIKLQLDELQKAQAKQGSLEEELRRLNSQPVLEQHKEVIPPSNNADPDPHWNGGSQPTASGIVVSPGVLSRLQHEVQSVVKRIEEKNETIGRLMKTADNQRNREEVLRKELKRAKQKANGKVKTGKEKGAASSRPLPGLSLKAVLTSKELVKEVKREPSNDTKKESSNDPKTKKSSKGSKASQKDKGARNQKKTLWPFPPKPPRSSGLASSTKASLCSDPKACSAHQKNPVVISNRGWSSL